MSWIFKTVGSYWIEVGADTLFQYSAEFLSNVPTGVPPTEEYVVDFIGRLYLAVTRLLPYALEEMPADIYSLLALNRQILFEEARRQWYSTAEKEIPIDDPIWDVYEEALLWRSDRTLDCDHLPYSPRIWCGRHQGDVLMGRDTSHCIADQTPVYRSISGSLTVSLGQFLYAVSSFKSCFLSDMEKRLTRSEDVGQTIAYKLKQLVNNPLKPASTDWETVRKALQVLNFVVHACNDPAEPAGQDAKA